MIRTAHTARPGHRPLSGTSAWEGRNACCRCPLHAPGSVAGQVQLSIWRTWQAGRRPHVHIAQQATGLLASHVQHWLCSAAYTTERTAAVNAWAGFWSLVNSSALLRDWALLTGRSRSSSEASPSLKSSSGEPASSSPSFLPLLGPFCRWASLPQVLPSQAGSPSLPPPAAASVADTRRASSSRHSLGAAMSEARDMLGEFEQGSTRSRVLSRCRMERGRLSASMPSWLLVWCSWRMRGARSPHLAHQDTQCDALADERALHHEALAAQMYTWSSKLL